MLIDRLYLQDFKNLKEFYVDFHISSSRQVVVGRNGVGKSNLLEALVWIFRDLDLEVESKFGYEIEYHCNGHFVKITATQSETKNGVAKFARTYQVARHDGPPTEGDEGRDYKPVSQIEFYSMNRPTKAKANPKRLLPNYVFGYYSGVSDRFNEAFARHEQIYYQQQISGEEAPLQPLFLAKPHHSQFALLSFFAAADTKAKRFLKDEFYIEGLESVLFALKEPYWWKGRKKKALADQTSDVRFWTSGGRVSPFLDALFKHALAPMSGSAKKQITIGQELTIERRYLFIPDEASLRRVAGKMQPKEFFARLESTVFSDVVSQNGQDVRIRVRLTGEKDTITFRELSEGEQQLLTIIGLMRFTAENEGLFLLDEPDTHLNPAWCLDFLQNLREYGVEPPNSQIIMTTHSPLTFAGLNENEVVILERSDGGQITADHPVSAPKGMGFQAILTSDFFGMRSTLDRETLAKLDEKRTLALKDKKTDIDRQRLTELDDELGRLDFSKAARDPLYLEFIHAITKAQDDHPELKKPAPEKADWRRRKEIAKDIVTRLAEQGEHS